MMEDSVKLHSGQQVRVTPDAVKGTDKLFSIGLSTLLSDLIPGDKIFINDGLIELSVKSVEPNALLCDVLAGGILTANKGCNIPSTKVSVDILTEKDREDLKLIARLKPEFVAASFIGSGHDIAVIRKTLHHYGASDVQIVSKIERPLALENMGTY